MPQNIEPQNGGWYGADGAARDASDWYQASARTSGPDVRRAPVRRGMTDAQRRRHRREHHCHNKD